MNKMMEYMALGKPTVAFDLPETRVSAGDAAVYVRPNDEKEFAARMEWLFENPDVGKRMGEAGQRRIAEEFAWEYSVPVLLRAYGQGLGVAGVVESTDDNIGRGSIHFTKDEKTR
jgi:glycosyltransferase involved in cell wall biosynthesis